MTPRFSLYLDAVRLSAALVVLLSHFAYVRFTRGDYLIIRELNLGSDAVVLFFVLSGLVIAFTVDRKDRAPGRYAFNRLTRLYSVVLPALALTFLFDGIGRAISPADYDGFWYNGVAPWEQAIRGVLINTEWVGEPIRIGSNGPFWSLSYEAAYYGLFGIAIFTRGLVRALALAIVALVAGPAIILLLPVWLMGVVVYQHLKSAGDCPSSRLWAMAVAPPLL